MLYLRTILRWCGRHYGCVGDVVGGCRMSWGHVGRCGDVCDAVGVFVRCQQILQRLLALKHALEGQMTGTSQEAFPYEPQLGPDLP